MMTVLRSKNLLIAVVLWIGFWPLAILIPREWLFDVVNGLAIAACFGVFVAYLPGVWNTVFRNDLDGAHYLVIGICGFAAAQGTRYGWNWLWRYLGKPPYMQDHLFVAWLIWVAFTFACVHLMARGVVHGEMPNRNFRWMGTVVALGTLAALIVIKFFEP